MYDRIVIAVDGSDEATRAATHGLELAAAFDASVDVLHVVERRALRLARSADETDRLRERGEAILETVEAAASEIDQPVTTELVEGDPSVRITERASERDASLIVVGRRGLTGSGRRLLGGVAERVLHRSDVPVLVVPGTDRAAGSEDGYDRVLVPTDGSENAELATPHGVAIAREYGATVHVLTVVDLQAAGGPFDVGGLDGEFVDRLEARGADAVESVAADVADAAPDLDVETVVRRTTTANRIAAGVREYVADRDVDLVVMGSHGRSNLRGRLLGSVASGVLRTVDVPVLVVTRES